MQILGLVAFIEQKENDNNDNLCKIHGVLYIASAPMKGTPNYMIYGEVGAYPLYCSAKSQMINYWINILCSKNNKLTSILYTLIFSETYIDPNFSSNWLNCIKVILDDCGLSYVWISQEMRNKMWLENYVKQNLKDQFLQRWKSDVENSSKSLCYRIYKTDFGYEK